MFFLCIKIQSYPIAFHHPISHERRDLNLCYVPCLSVAQGARIQVYGESVVGSRCVVRNQRRVGRETARVSQMFELVVPFVVASRFVVRQ